ncbi:MAG TPA: hypothetical protein VJV23_09935, partial [Candidatus Polarisedimenticolia bacterium]|nr:hypothetical protein [Candidatus Polarisedimenticolia bacterium]
MRGRVPGAARLTAGFVLATTLLWASPSLPAAREEPPPVPDLRGPLSDFWAKVKRDWARRITGLNRGPLQTAVWVAMVWEGPDDLAASGEPGEAIARLADVLQERDAMRWVRAQITKHRWSRIARRDVERMQAMHQNVILLGTPSDNPLVERALAGTPLRVTGAGVWVAGRKAAGDGLLVIALAPNPIDPRHYSLVITGTSVEAVLGASSAPYGATDYLVLQGHRVIEKGFYRWKAGRPAPGEVAGAESFVPFRGWRSLSTRRTLVTHPPSMPGEQARRAGLELDGAIEGAASFLELDPGEPLALHLYDTLARKVEMTADARPAHLHEPSGALHAVAGEGLAAPGSALAALAARALLLRDERGWGGRARRELPGLAAAVPLAAHHAFETIPLDSWAAASGRDAGELPMSVLFSRPPGDPAQGDLSALDVAAFVRHLAEAGGTARLKRLHRTARKADLPEVFKTVYGMSLRQAEARWLATLPAHPAAAAPHRGRPEEPAAGPPGLDAARRAFLRREDGEAERLLAPLPATPEVLTLRSRLAFRAGRFEEAARMALEALEAPAAGAGDRAWAALT